jgi:hypothetical protein
VVSAFNTTGFQVGLGPKGEAVLGQDVGQGGRINFLLPGSMPEELSAILMNLVSATKARH